MLERYLVNQMKLSLSGFLFEDNYQQQSVTFREFAELANTLGYSGMELRRTQINLETPRAVIDEYKAILDDNGLPVTCLTPRGMPNDEPERTDFFKRYLDLASGLNCPLLKVSGSADWLRKACDLANPMGIIIGTNNHINSPTETLSETDRLLSDVDRENYCLLFDPLHLSLKAQNCPEAVDRFFPKIANVLVQCLRKVKPEENASLNRPDHAYVKTRIDQDPIQNWPGILAGLKKRGYNGWITVIENDWPRDQRKEVAKVTASYLKELWEKV